MSVYFESLTSLTETSAGGSLIQRAAAMSRTLAETFDTEFQVYDGEAATLLYAPAGQPPGFPELRGQLARQVGFRRLADAIEDEGPVVTVAIPQVCADGSTLVAAATFVTRPVSDEENVASAARVLGLEAEAARAWISRQEVWPARTILRTARLAVDKLAADQRIAGLRREVAALSDNISTTYEEISLLYRLTHNLSLAISDEELSRIALEWLAATVPVEGLAALLMPPPDLDMESREARQYPVILTEGDWPLALGEFSAMVSAVDASESRRPIVLNHLATLKPSWQFASVRELIVVPLREGNRCFGYLAAVNHTEGKELGTVEANLLSSVASILGIHCGNSDLYRRRADLLTGIVRALTSAIDAKDPYTCGHSDRVARISERIAKELGLDRRTLHTIYLSGLLHDIGKIGIDDQVLRKPGALTPAEFEHIKMHPELGYKILVDLKELDEVLPVVLHHHENWDGRGYPHGLAGEAIPFLARIVAVADAFDAMGSDRPYRQGMPDEKVDAILRSGAGAQWDPQVIAAFFSAREDIREIARQEREGLLLNIHHWL